MVATVGSLAALAVAVAIAWQQSTRVEDLEDKQEAQSDRVVRVLRENRKITAEHQAIGAQLADAEKRLRAALQQARGRRARLPAKLEPLRPFVRRGFLAPRRLPNALARREVAIRRYRDGYALTWPGGLSFVASTRRAEPLRVLIAAAPRRDRRRLALGSRRVTRIRGPVSVYAWNERGRTYTLLASRRFHAVALALIRRTR